MMAVLSKGGPKLSEGKKRLWVFAHVSCGSISLGQPSKAARTSTIKTTASWTKTILRPTKFGHDVGWHLACNNRRTLLTAHFFKIKSQGCSIGRSPQLHLLLRDFRRWHKNPFSFFAGLCCFFRCSRNLEHSSKVKVGRRRMGWFTRSDFLHFRSLIVTLSALPAFTSAVCWQFPIVTHSNRQQQRDQAWPEFSQSKLKRLLYNNLFPTTFSNPW